MKQVIGHMVVTFRYNIDVSSVQCCINVPKELGISKITFNSWFSKAIGMNVKVLSITETR